MKKMICGMLFWLCYCGLTYAGELGSLPDRMYLTQHWVSYTTSFDIETKTRKIGTLYRRVLSFPLAYDFYDYSNHWVTSAQARFFSIGAHFDVTDNKKMPLGSVEEKIFTFFPSFTIVSNDGEKLASAEMNFWGTTFTVYDMETGQVMALMHRPFFRIKNNWTIDIINKQLLRSKNINQGLFLTVLAFQADREYWEQQRNNENHKRKRNRSLANETEFKPEAEAQAKITARLEDASINQFPLMDAKALESLTTTLSNNYQAHMQSINSDLTPADEINGFVNYCLNLIDTNQVSGEEKRAILYLIQQRFSDSP